MKQWALDSAFGQVNCLKSTKENASQVVLAIKNLPANAGDVKDKGSIPEQGRSPGEGNGKPLQYSCIENPMDRGAYWAIVHRVTKSRTRLKQLHMHACTHTHTHTHIQREQFAQRSRRDFQLFLILVQALIICSLLTGCPHPSATQCQTYHNRTQMFAIPLTAWMNPTLPVELNTNAFKNGMQGPSWSGPYEATSPPVVQSHLPFPGCPHLSSSSFYHSSLYLDALSFSARKTSPQPSDINSSMKPPLICSKQITSLFVFQNTSYILFHSITQHLPHCMVIIWLFAPTLRPVAVFALSSNPPVSVFWFGFKNLLNKYLVNQHVIQH